jgi:demethylmenaquinone methyltransferase/2-methoxy-6-polyprenyl-1,4-benzoquinol methylase
VDDLDRRPAMRIPPTRPPSFACLWCGRSWTVRSPDDLEGLAKLCPDCLGKAGDNEFLRFRLRAALEARAALSAPAALSSPAAVEPVDAGPARPSGVASLPSDPDMIAYYQARAPEYDDWYLRRGRYEHGPIHDAAWNAELDAAGRWLDNLPIAGRIVELAAGTGWWSPLLASKGELWMYDAAEAPLARARERLVAHRLRAHLHVRDAWAEPSADATAAEGTSSEGSPAEVASADGSPADALFAGFWLSHVERARTGAFLELAARWLAPGGRIALIDSLPDPRSGAVDHEPPADDRSVRRLDDGRAFTIVKVYRSEDEIAAALIGAGFRDVEVTTTGRFFLLATGRRA